MWSSKRSFWLDTRRVETMSILGWLVFAAEEQQGTGTGNPFYQFLIPLGLLFVVMYFLMLRPQRKKDQERREMLSSIKRNDHVVTIGGIRGVITSVKEDELVLRVDDAKDVRLKFSRSAISRVLKPAEGEGADTEE